MAHVDAHIKECIGHDSNKDRYNIEYDTVEWQDNLEILVTSVFSRGNSINIRINVDLSGFSNGDTCHFVGNVSSESSGSPDKTVLADNMFVWSDNNICEVTDGTYSYTLKFESNGITFTDTNVLNAILMLGRANDPLCIYKIPKAN